MSDSDAPAGQATFRGRAGGVDGERTYDSFYWIASQFVHANPLSVVGSSTSALDKEPPPIKELFAWDSSYFPFTTLPSVMISGTRTYAAAERVAALGHADKLERFGVVFREGAARVGWILSEDIPAGVMEIKCTDGRTTVLKTSPTRRRR